jgi:hypothetical protein
MSSAPPSNQAIIAALAEVPGASEATANERTNQPHIAEVPEEIRRAVELRFVRSIEDAGWRLHLAAALPAAR